MNKPAGPAEYAHLPLRHLSAAPALRGGFDYVTRWIGLIIHGWWADLIIDTASHANGCRCSITADWGAVGGGSWRNANQRYMSGAGEKEWKPSLAWIVFVFLICFFLEHLKQRILAIFFDTLLDGFPAAVWGMCGHKHWHACTLGEVFMSWCSSIHQECCYRFSLLIGN